MKKNKYKKLAQGFRKGFKETADFAKKYGPKVHAASKKMSEATMDVMMPRRTKTVVDLTAKRKPSRVVKGKGGFYLDYTK